MRSLVVNAVRINKVVEFFNANQELYCDVEIKNMEFTLGNLKSLICSINKCDIYANVIVYGYCNAAIKKEVVRGVELCVSQYNRRNVVEFDAENSVCESRNGSFAVKLIFHGMGQAPQDMEIV